MPGITVNGINFPLVATRAVTVSRTDGGQERGLRLEVETGELAWATGAERVRMLAELAANADYARLVTLVDDEDALNNGLYRLESVDAPLLPLDMYRRAVIDLTRLGGSGVGGNVARRLRVAPTLATNAYSISQDVRYALPVGAVALEGQYPATTRSGADGEMRVLTATAGERYLLTAADTNKGECKVWDTGGDAQEANWKRVYGPDHVFADPAHCVIDNSLVRFTPFLTGNRGAHAVAGWSPGAGAWVTVSGSSQGDSFQLGGAVVTEVWSHVDIDELSPHRVVVTWTAHRATSPEVYWKRITLRRGQYLAAVAIGGLATAVNIELGLDGGGRFVATRQKGARDTDNDAAATLADLTTAQQSVAPAADNWLAVWNPALALMGVVATAVAADFIANAVSTGGGRMRKVSVTGHTFYLGAIPWSTTRDAAEAEAGTLVGGATADPGPAGSSGSGNNTVVLNALNEGVHTSALQTMDQPGARVIAYFRVACNSIAASTGNVWTFSIFDGTTHQGAVTKNPSQFAANNGWEWVSVEWGGWDGSIAIYPYARKTGSPDATICYVDQMLFLTVNGQSNADFRRVRDVATAALTDVRVWEDASRRVF